MSIEAKVTAHGLRVFGDEMTVIEYAGFIPAWLRRFVMGVAEGRYSATPENLTDHCLLEYGFPNEPFRDTLLDEVDGFYFMNGEDDPPLQAHLILTVLDDLIVVLFDYGIVAIGSKSNPQSAKFYRFD